MGRPPETCDGAARAVPVRRRGAEPLSRAARRLGRGLAQRSRPIGRSRAASRPGRRERVLPGVVAATAAAGPDALAKAVRDLVERGDADDALAAWLAGEPLAPVERYLARATLQAPLVALGSDAGAACAGNTSPQGDRRCPSCGGEPQLSFRGHDDDPLVSGRRHLVCARCAHDWVFSGSACPACGDTSESRSTVFAEQRSGPVVGRGDSGGGTTATTAARAATTATPRPSRTCASPPARGASAT